MVSEQDPAIEQLARLFREHPAWRRAAAHLSENATSNVYFTHRAGETWHLRRTDDGSELWAGAAREPDFVLRFTPRSIDCLAAAGSTIGEFAVELFTRVVDESPETHVDLRIVADFSQLRRRGYAKLLLAGGPSVLAFGARHGISSLRGLRRFVTQLQKRAPADWET